MTALILEPGKKGYVEDIQGSLKDLQERVGGLIDAVFLSPSDPVAIFVNEEGALLGLSPNRSLRDANNNVYCVLRGTAVLLGIDGSEVCGLSESLANKYLRRYGEPEQFHTDESLALDRWNYHWGRFPPIEL